jgi:glutamate dehydrogenase (NADP+)
MYKLGGAGGGSDFDPRGRSDGEVKSSTFPKLENLPLYFQKKVDNYRDLEYWQIMHFCQSFMDELYRYLGSDQVTELTSIYPSFFSSCLLHLKTH